MGGIGNSNYHISPPSRRKFPRMLAILGSCLLLVIHLPTSLGEPACEMKFSVPLEGSIDDDLNFVTNDGLVYKSGDYWLHRRTYRGCICTVKPCLQKCCRNGFVTNDKMSCVPENSTTPNMDQLLPGFDFFIEGDDKKLELVKDLPTNHSHVILPENQNFTCEAYELNEKEKEGFKVLKDGRMKIPPPEDVPNGETYYGWDEFCMEVNSQTGKLMPYVCFPPENVRKESLNIYPYFLILSVFFLILTLIVYILLPPLRNNPAKCMMNLVVSLIIGYSFLAQQQIYRKPLPRKLCRFVAYTIYFFLMASYFWLNVMCYDIYSAFKTMKSVARSRTKKRNVMIAHCFYAWGSPFVMMVIAYFVDMYGPDYIIKPRLAVTSCWFGQTSSLYLYFYGPMMILLFANIFFFSVTIYKLYQVSKQTEVLKNTESKRHHQKEKDRCFLYGKLFVVMGVTWIMEVVSERIGGQEFWWYPTDIINICQGIGIFVIFVLKRRVLYMLNQKFCPSLNLIKESESPSSKPTSSSTGSTSQNGIAMNGATLNGNGNATNGNARREAPGNVYVGEEGYENPIPMTPLAERNNGDASIPIDDTDTRRRY